MSDTSLAALPVARDELLADLRRLIAQIESGERQVTSAIVVMRHREEGKVSRALCGEVMSYSATMGLLAYASHMLYAEAD